MGARLASRLGEAFPPRCHVARSLTQALDRHIHLLSTNAIALIDYRHAVGLLSARSAPCQRVVFEGEPLKKVEISVEGTAETQLASEDAFKAQVRIIERDGRYYWQSRGMKELKRSESSAYITYAAADGSGYVRTHIPMMLDLRLQLPKEQRVREIDYSEHLLIQFASITYFGNRLTSNQ
jgi:hypothetical protein